MRIGNLIFNKAEEMDFVGPWEVLSVAIEGKDERSIQLIAPSLAPVTCDKGMRVLPGGAGAGFVVDGNLVTAVGVTSGIEMSFWLVEGLFGRAAEAYTQDYISYDTPARRSAVYE